MQLMTRHEAAEFLRISEATLIRLGTKNDFPTTIRLSGRVMYERDDLIAYVERHRLHKATRGGE